MTGRPQCRFQRDDGSTCNATATSSGLCYFHDPRYADKRAEARRKGGVETRRRRTKLVLPHDTMNLPLNNPEEVASALAKTFNEVRRGEVDVRTANCLALIGSTILRAFHGEDRQLTVNVKPAGPEKTLIGPEILQQLLADARREHDLREQHNHPQIGLRQLPLANGENIDHAE